MRRLTEFQTLIHSCRTIVIHKYFYGWEKVKKSKPGKSFLVKVEVNPKWGSSPYFLSMWVNSKSVMEDKDSFLRSIWLECCGHMSTFSNPKNKRSVAMWDLFDAQQLLMKAKKAAYEKMMEDANGEISMSRKIYAVFSKGLKLKYEYDFGSTTSLQLTVAGEFPIQADRACLNLLGFCRLCCHANSELTQDGCVRLRWWRN